MPANELVDVLSIRPPSPRARARPIRLGLLGYGRVGQAVADLVARESAALQGAGLDVSVDAALVRDRGRPRSGPHVDVLTDAADLLARRPDVIVEVLGGTEPARRLVREALSRRIPVVTANKTLLAHHGRELCAAAMEHDTPFAFDAAVLAGVPCLGALARRPLVSAARRITGILNGTSQFIVSAVTRGASFSVALAEAERLGLAEPDSAADISGRDAAEKLAVLIALAGGGFIEPDRVPSARIDTLTPLDGIAARRLGGVIKPVAIAELDAPGAGAWVGPAFVPDDHPFARLDGVDNVVCLTRRDGHGVSFVGPGAGPEVTALTILDDVVEVATSRVRPLVRVARVDATLPRLDESMTAGWFLRINGAAAWRGTTIEQRLANRHVGTIRVQSLGDAWFVRTLPVSGHQLQYAVTAIRAHGAEVRAWPVLD